MTSHSPLTSTTPTFQDIDQESQQFITWAFEQLEDDTIYRAMIDEAISQAKLFYDQPKEIVLPQLKQKMIIGAQEHGAPTHTPEAVTQELAKEYIDLLGWLLVGKWVTKKLEER